MLSSEKHSLNFLVVSDIHKDTSWDWLNEKIQQELKTEKFDFILNGGDFTFISYDFAQSEEEVKEKTQLFSTIMTGLEEYKIPHFYVPGNHDPLVEYSKKTSVVDSIPSSSLNIHKRCVQILPHLWIVGCGGSVPTTMKDGKLYSEGYPYCLNDMEEGIAECLKLIPEKDHVIILTHTPPAHIGKLALRDLHAGSSFMDYRKHENIELFYGSETLYKEVVEGMKTRNIFLFVHGHVHHEPGMNWIHRSGKHCCFVNPGAAYGGKYAKVKIEWMDDRWKVVNVQHILDY